MKVFISHSSKDLELAKAFSYFLKTLNMEIEIYCTSLQGTINQGENFISSIESGLKGSEVFIPLISQNYCKSKYCLIELGYAYCKLAAKQKYYILPFSIPPISKAEALLSTPLSYLQTSALNDKNDIENFVKILIRNRLIPETALMKVDINEFVNRINTAILNSGNILENAIILPICSDGRNPEAIFYTKDNNNHIVNFNLNANSKGIRPEFISLVFKFPGTFNFADFLFANNNMELTCVLNNYTDSLTNIDIEFKYCEIPQKLFTAKINLNSGKNEIKVPIKGMHIEGLKQISEICFVAWDNYITEIEGMFSIEDIKIS